MHKNPFIPQPSYPVQPPLPPGPPPPPPTGQPDYSAYWSGQQQQQQPGAYNSQWSATNPQWHGGQVSQPVAPPKPPSEQAALFANYGYGGQHSAHWQQHQQHQQHQQQHQQHQHHPHHQPHYAQPPAPAVPAVAPQPYTPYQPQPAPSAYNQPYTPQAVVPQPPMQQYRPPQPPQAPAQPYFQQQNQHAPSHPQHSPHQLPPAKRQRFDNSSQATPMQPRFQAPSAPMGHQNVPMGPSRPNGIPSGPSQANHMQSQGSFNGRGGMGAGRVGPGMNRGGRGNQMGASRGMVQNRGRGSMHVSGRGSLGPSGGSMRGGHHNRDGGGFRNYNQRGGGSFTNGPRHNQNNASFRGRGGGQMHGFGRNARSDGHGRSQTVGSSSANSHGKRDENRRTLTDFKIIGLELPDLGWRWGQTAPLEVEEVKKEEAEDKRPDETEEKEKEDSAVKAEDAQSELIITHEAEAVKESASESDKVTVKESVDSRTVSSSASAARMRIYFHTPPSADDAHPITSASAHSDSRKGKRKKLDDDEEDAEDGARAPPPPPGPNRDESVDGDSTLAPSATPAMEYDGSTGRGSIAPSVAETASEGDWLMAAIAEGEADGEGESVEEQVEVEHGMDVHEHDGGSGATDGTHALNGHSDEIATDELVVTLADDPAHANDESGGLQEGAGADHRDNVSKVGRQGEAVAASAATLDSASSGPVPVGETVVAEAEKKSDADILAESGDSELRTSQLDSSAPESGGTQATELIEASTQDANDISDKATDVEHLPEPPASPTSNTAFSGTTSTPPNTDLPSKPITVGSKVPSANRVSISYAGGSRRLLIDAEIVDKLILFRGEGRAEIEINVERTDDGFKGILIEMLDEASKNYSPLQELNETSESDALLPPLWKLGSSAKTLFTVYLDKERPLSEPKWVKTGDVSDWLKDMFGGRFWVAGEAVGWEKKIEVRYPDPAPTIQTVLQSWSVNSSNLSSLSERQRFLKTHMTDSNNVLELLLRLIRGERATANARDTSVITVSTLTGPLLTTWDTELPHMTQQTHVSLAVMAIVRLTEQIAEQAFGEGKGKSHVEERIGEIIKCLPNHLLYKGLDGMFKEWRAEKKGGR